MLRTLTLRSMVVSTCMLALLAACNDDDDDPAGPGGDPLVSTWNATSLTATGIPDPIGLGMTMTMTLSSGGTFTLVFTNDLVGFCDGEANCTQTGTYTSTATTLTIDPSDSDPGTFNYTISGNVLTLTGDIDGSQVTLVFQKA
jgi:hypothetical protein